MKKYNVIIISNDKQAAEALASKVLLSRKSDSVAITDFDKAVVLLKKQVPDIIIMYIENEKQVNLVKAIKEDKILQTCFVIMSLKTVDNDILCKGFDAGIDDVLDVNENETLFSMRIFWALKNKLCRELLTQKSDILALQKITRKETGFYLADYVPQIFSKEYQKCLTAYQKAVLMLIEADKKSKDTLSVFDIGKIVSSVIRSSDIAAYRDNVLYLLLKNTDEHGAKDFYNKINNSFPFDISVSAAAIDISVCDKFSEAEKILVKKLQTSSKDGNSFAFISQNQAVSPLFDKINPTFEQSLTKEIKKFVENTVTPVFFKMQSIYEHKLFNTDIKQVFGDKECSFILKSKGFKTIITVKYDNSENITVETKEICKQDTDCDIITMLQSEFTGDKLEQIIQAGAEKFRINLSKSEEQ
ncbi:MAG: hypothetical protein K6C94_00635 [Candidatus Gastranaerophilales bacterium]|nr:hypothetical protein [Candidatus Gastranaerophilales bacterium]